MRTVINENPDAKDYSHLPLVPVIPIGVPTRNGVIYPRHVVVKALMSEQHQNLSKAEAVVGEVIDDAYKGRDTKELGSVKLENVGVRVRELLIEEATALTPAMLLARIEPFGPQAEHVREVLDQKSGYSIGLRAQSSFIGGDLTIVTDMSFISFDVLPAPQE